MALQDFIQKLKEQDDSDVIYSKEPEHSIQIIPPEKTSSSITLEKPKPSLKIIPPSDEHEDKPKTIKFKLNVVNSSKVVEAEVQTAQSTTMLRQPPVDEQPAKSILQKPSQPVQKEQPKEQPKPLTQKPTIPQKPTEEQIVEELFLKSGTSMAKRALWYEYYEKAKISRKKNSIVERMKQGKFAITVDNQVLILPDYNIQHKSSSQLLSEKWLKN